MIDKQAEILKFVTEQILNYTHYHITVDSLDISVPDIKTADFFANRFKLKSQVTGDDVVIIKAKDVNITEAIATKNNVDFDVYLIYYINGNVITDVNIEIHDFDFVESDEITVYIKDFINLYMKYIFGGILEVFNQYTRISHQDTEDVVIEFTEDIKITFLLSKGNNLPIGIKALFMNDVDVVYNLNYTPELLEHVDDYSKPIFEKIKQLFDNMGSLVTDLNSFDTVTASIDTKLLKERYSSLIDGESVSNDDISKELIYNSMMRSGEATISDILTLYDKSEYLSVEDIAYVLTVGEDKGAEGEIVDEPETETDDNVEPDDGDTDADDKADDTEDVKGVEQTPDGYKAPKDAEPEKTDMPDEDEDPDTEGK